MKIKTEKKMVEVYKTTYVAEDGTEFETEISCIGYEKKLDNLKEKVNKLRLVALDNMYPLDTDGQEIYESKCYSWYQVCNEEDYNILNEFFDNEISKPTSFPEIICIETDDYDYCYLWDYHLSNMKQSTIAFWKEFGYEVEFKEK